jgi:hypothetical protein
MVRQYHQRVRILLVLTLVVPLTACAGRGGGAGSASLSATPAASPALRASPTEHLEQPPGPEIELTGILGYDDELEGGCAYLQTDADTRYEVLYPDGWKLQGNRLRNPAGDIAAIAGDTVTVRGVERADAASICQIGPIFQATAVVTIDR